MAFLKAIVDITKVDANTVNNIVVPFALSTLTGITGFDATAFFTELSTDANRKKVKFWNSDKTIQFNAEIENGYDFSAKKVVYYVQVGTLFSGVADVFYLEYDSSFADNTTYIGDTGEAAAQAVWPSLYYQAVYTMAQDPTGGAGSILDSTSHGNDATPSDTWASGDLVDGQLGKALSFSGSNSLSIPSGIIGTIETEFTIEFLGKADNTSAEYRAFSYNDDDNFILFRFNETSANNFQFLVYDGASKTVSDNSMTLTDYNHLVMTAAQSGNLVGYGNGVSVGSIGVGSFAEVATIGRYIGAGRDNTLQFPGDINFVAITIDEREGEWVKATSYAFADDLLTFSVPVPEKVDTPDISPTSGAVPSGQLITLTSVNADSIYWTDNGVDPTPGDNLYTVPFAITSAVTIKAYGVASGLDDSDVASESYTIAVVVVAVQPIITIQT